MSRFDADPDFTLRWPPELFAEEVRRLIERAELEGIDHGWRTQVETLLRQAFVTTVPADEVSRLLDLRPNHGYLDEPPF